MSATAAMIAIAGFTAPVAASVPTTVVDGSGVLTDDFGDHYDELGNSLCNGCANSNGTDLVLMWQAILFAEGYLSKSDLDGQFGPRTADATKKWQSKAGLTADGKVGPATWGKADDRLRWSPAPGGKYWRVVYDAREGMGTVELLRGDNGVFEANGRYRLSRAVEGGESVGFSGTSGIRLFARTIRIL